MNKPRLLFPFLVKPLVFSSFFFSLFFSCSSDKSAFDPQRLGRSGTVPQNLKILDVWLQDRESRFPALRAEADKKIIWKDPILKTKTPLALVYLHGYTATRKEIDPAPTLLAAELGANLFYTRLTGHGLTPDAHKDVRMEDWLDDALEALEMGERLGNKVVIVATSTGGTLGVWLAQSSVRERVAAEILVSPNLTPKNSQLEWLLWPFSEMILKLALGDYREFTPNNDYKARYWDTKTSTHSLIPMMHLVDLARKGDFDRWKTPALVFYDPQDQVVDEAVTVKLFQNKKMVKLRPVENSGDPEHHVLVGDAEAPQFTPVFVAEAAAFIRQTLN